MSRKTMEQCNAQKYINRIIDFLPTNRQFQYIATVKILWFSLNYPFG
jgi:Tfp pilus assembly ATPase PilU